MGRKFWAFERAIRSRRDDGAVETHGVPALDTLLDDANTNCRICCRSTIRAWLAISLSLIGPLTPVPPGDPASPPEVRSSSVPCRPHTPWWKWGERSEERRVGDECNSR